MSPVTSPKIRRYYDLLEDDPMRRYADFDERRLFRREEAEILRREALAEERRLRFRERSPVRGGRPGEPPVVVSISGRRGLNDCINGESAPPPESASEWPVYIVPSPLRQGRVLLRPPGDPVKN